MRGRHPFQRRNRGGVARRQYAPGTASQFAPGRHLPPLQQPRHPEGAHPFKRDRAVDGHAIVAKEGLPEAAAADVVQVLLLQDEVALRERPQRRGERRRQRVQAHVREVRLGEEAQAVAASLRRELGEVVRLVHLRQVVVEQQEVRRPDRDPNFRLQERPVPLAGGVRRELQHREECPRLPDLLRRVRNLRRVAQEHGADRPAEVATGQRVVADEADPVGGHPLSQHLQ